MGDQYKKSFHPQKNKGRKESALPPKLQVHKYRPLNSTIKGTGLMVYSPTAPKVERFSLSPIRTSHRLSEEIYKSQLLSALS
jgi:hypothetical protein